MAHHYCALGLPTSNYVIYDKFFNVEPAGAEITGYNRKSFFNRTYGQFCSHLHTPCSDVDSTPAVAYGKDGAYIAWNVFTEYALKGSYINKDTVIRVLDRLLGESKTLETNLPSAGVVTLNDQAKESRLVLHSLYAIPIQRGIGIQIIEDLVPIYNTEFKIRTDKAIKRAVLVPEGREIAFTKKDGAYRFTIEEFTSSQMVALEY